MAKVLIVGYGEMGRAMSHLLHNKHQLSIHDSRPVRDLPVINVDEQASLAEYILLCVPASPLQELLVRLAPLLRRDCICLSIAKGLDESGRTPAQIYQMIFNDRQPHCLLYGPMISEEIRADRYAFAELGCTDISTFHNVRGLFQDTKLLIRHSTDIAGISWSVILKNVYAIAFGIADGLNLGDNMRGFLTVNALHEIGEIVQQMGGKSRSTMYLAGLGDLITTATSLGSHHHQLGINIAQGKVESLSGEGIHTLAMVKRYRLFDASAYTLYTFIQDVILDPVNVSKKFDAYLSSIRE